MDYTAFASAQPATQDLVRNWFHRARLEGPVHPYRSLEPFIYLWISFNAWASRVTGAERDAEMVKALATDRRLSEAFNALYIHSDRFREAVHHFATFWPIFSVIDLRKHGLFALLQMDRGAAIETLLAARVRRGPVGIYDREHPTWRMCVEAIYVVRCNVFHGAKGDAADDAEIVRCAHETLAGFIDGTNLYGWQN